MRLMVLDEHDSLAIAIGQAFADLARQVQLLLQPDWHRPNERAKSSRREREIRLQQPLELQQRLVVETDEVELFRLKAGLSQAKVDGVFWETIVVLLTSKTLLLGRRDNVAV